LRTNDYKYEVQTTIRLHPNNYWFAPRTTTGLLANDYCSALVVSILSELREGVMRTYIGR